MVEANMCSYEDFPKSELKAEGMKTIEANRQPCYSQVLWNVEYAKKDGYPLHLQIILPPMEIDPAKKKPHKSYPLILYIQGSAWRKQNLGQQVHGLCEFAKRGYVIAIVEYRPSDTAIFPAQVKDVKTAIRFMQDKAEQFFVDANRIYVWGDSSGGHTCAMIAATMEREYNDETGPLNVKAFVDFYGPTDITKMNDVPSAMDHILPQSPEGMLIGGKRVDETPEMTDQVCIMNHIDEKTEFRPILMIHGNKDRLVPFQQSVLLYEKLKETHKTVEFYCLDGADHGGDAFFDQKVLDIVENFIRQY